MANITMAAIKNVSLDTQDIASTFSGLSFQEFIAGIKPLLFFIVGVTIYAVFVFKFYRFLSRRDIFKLETQEYWQAYEGAFKHTLKLAFYVLENLVLIPLLVFFWSTVLAFLLLMLSKEPNPELVLLTGASIVAAVRITAYYNENLSQDLAKMVPFALLGVFLIDVSHFSISSAITAAKAVPSLFKVLLYYLFFVTALEFILRITHGIAGLVVKKKIETTE